MTTAAAHKYGPHLHVAGLRPNTLGTIDERITRLVAAGLTEDAARKVATHPCGGPVKLADGVVVSLFPPSKVVGSDG